MVEPSTPLTLFFRHSCDIYLASRGNGFVYWDGLFISTFPHFVSAGGDKVLLTTWLRLQPVAERKTR